MSEILKINTEELSNYTEQLNAGDKILLSGIVYTSRDAAHKRIKVLIESGEKLPTRDLLLLLRNDLSVHADLLPPEEWINLHLNFLISDYAV